MCTMHYNLTIHSIAYNKALSPLNHKLQPKRNDETNATTIGPWPVQHLFVE
jgi:hypothetical protein